jgi:hypothetical protein
MEQREFESKLQEFLSELDGFAGLAEETLKKIESNLVGNRHLFDVFAKKMVAIRGTAQQLGFDFIAEMSGLSEEIAARAVASDRRPELRKSVGALWDALTTIRFLLKNYKSEVSEEQKILAHRLQHTLSALGGKRDSFSPDEIQKMLGQ